MLLRDCRSKGREAFLQCAEVAATNPGANGIIATAWQVDALPPPMIAKLEDRVMVTAPDFFNYARLLNTGQAAAIAKLPRSLAKSGLAGLRASPALLANPLRAARMDFWLFAEVLFRYDLALLPSAFRAPVLLHSQLADFAFVFGKHAFVKSFFKQAGSRPVGIHTQQLPLALSSLAVWGLKPAWVSFLFSPGDSDSLEALESARRNPLFMQTRFIGEIDSMPVSVQNAESIATWNCGLDGWLVS